MYSPTIPGRIPARLSTIYSYSISHSVTLCLAFSLQPYPHSQSQALGHLLEILINFSSTKFQCYRSIVVEVMFSWN